MRAFFATIVISSISLSALATIDYPVISTAEIIKMREETAYLKGQTAAMRACTGDISQTNKTHSEQLKMLSEIKEKCFHIGRHIGQNEAILAIYNSAKTMTPTIAENKRKIQDQLESLKQAEKLCFTMKQ